jgi:hypothetical protein
VWRRFRLRGDIFPRPTQDNETHDVASLGLGGFHARRPVSAVLHVRVRSWDDHDGVGFALPSDHERRATILAVHRDNLADAYRLGKMPGQHNQSVACNSLHLRHHQTNNRDIAIVCRPAADGTGRWSRIDRDQRPTHALAMLAVRSG